MAAGGRGDVAMRAQAAEMLVKAGADVTITNDDGQTALQRIDEEDAAASPQLVRALTP
jgi:predicted Fe-Mo cluster-binding NifX family protein